jgi:hypothetical protein
MRTAVRAFVLTVLLALASCVGDEPQRSVDETPQPARKHEVLSERPSGFWTSNQPSKHGAYRWRLLAIGVGIGGITGILMWRLVRRANAQRRSTVARN